VSLHAYRRRINISVARQQGRLNTSVFKSVKTRRFCMIYEVFRYIKESQQYLNCSVIFDSCEEAM